KYAFYGLAPDDVTYHGLARQPDQPGVAPTVDIPQLSQKSVVLRWCLAKTIPGIENDAAAIDPGGQGGGGSFAQEGLHLDKNVVVLRRLLHGLGLALHMHDA